MRKLLSLAALTGFFATSALHAQWKSETYNLKGGWTAIYLHGDASYTTPAEIFRNYPTVLEVWRWNPNPDQVQFTGTPATPDASSAEWTIWNRNDPDEQQLTAMVGQSAYLVHSSGASTTTTAITILQKPKPPAATWLITGANFLGFPADASTPVMSSYFASFPVATASPSKIYKYIGGDLNATNPLQVSPTAERIDRNTAYWFEAATVGNFTSPIEYELPGTDGIAFGRTGSTITVGIMNRSTSAFTLTFSTVASANAPTGQPGITGAVPLTRLTLDATTGLTTETPVTGAFTVSVPASGRLDLQLGINRTLLTGDSNAVYASLLRVKDSGGFSDVYLPVSAQIASPAGLWVGQIDVTNVNSTVTSSPGSTTTRSFPLRMLVHVDAGNTARLLSQAFVGTLAASGNQGICTTEARLLSSKKTDAMRIVSSQMPLDKAIAGSGSFAVGSTLTHVVTIPFDDATNPFVHEYHPDHDNRDARLAPLAAGVESYNLTRRITFTFTSTPPGGGSVTGWGSTIYGGTYSETIEGLNKNPLTVSGTFAFRRVSEIADITTN